MSATLAHNPRHATGESPRRTLASSFTVRMPDCIECGICVDVCRYDAIALAPRAGGSVAPQTEMEELLERGREYQGALGGVQPPRPDVRSLLEAAIDRLPPASASDAARRARSRLRHSLPVEVRTSTRRGGRRTARR
jgi:ferredoxin